jgi:hypothetical protein
MASATDSGRADIIKIDVGGRQLGVLKSAEDLFGRRPRPAMLPDLADSRTLAWGCGATYDALAAEGGPWFAITQDGKL